jgi:DNA-binding CsgD family transcriptional regulator
MVWDLGCILIHLLLGNHKLRNYEILEKFKGEPFSFKKIGANIYKKLNPKLQ